MVKQAIQIFARVKPTKKATGIYSIDDENMPSLDIIVPHDLADGFVNNKRESYKFKFRQIFDQGVKQEDVFETVARPVVDSALAGYNGTIFAYGQTGSGKTFTITGGAERYSDRGIIPRTLSYLFQQYQKDSNNVYTTHISYLEIYNECGFDLLDPRHEASKLEDLPKVSIMEDPDQSIHLKHLSLQQATNEEEALNLLFLGDTNRMIAETPMNQASTRSHCIFTIHLSSREPGSATIRRSKLHLVDLAGSERVSKTGVGGQLLTEAKYINLSLHYLEQVIIALGEKNRSHIPYRNSMMTSVLRDSLGGNCMTTMIATLSVEKRNIDESISTCRFAQRVALIKNEAVLNEEIDPQLMIVRLKKEIQALKDELAMVTGEQRTEELVEDELLKLQDLIKRFLEDSDPEATLEVGADMRKIQHCFTYLKQLANERRVFENTPSLTESCLGNSNNTESSSEDVKKIRDLLHQRDNEINILVNMLKKEKKRAQDAINQLQACFLTHSLTETSTSSTESSLKQKSFIALHGQDNRDSQGTALIRKKLEVREGSLSLGRQEAFEIFKRDYEDKVTIEDNKQLLKERFSEAKFLGEQVNEARNRINHLKGQIEQRRMQRAASGVTSDSIDFSQPDPVEDELRAQIEVEKKSYKITFNRLKGLKTEIEHLQFLLEKAKVKLQKDFEVWWSEEASRLQVPVRADGKHEKAHISVSKSSRTTNSLSPTQSQLNLASNRSSAAEDISSIAAIGSRSYTSSVSDTRPPVSPEGSIPLTGDSQTDADILAFVKARQNLMQRKGLEKK
ncbi:kinesin-like protein KIF6 [Protopterus annectens]|uniref:kinesin-like protein KIF6 n=1 Tax=Protopterus annectens TaxID=7888 RepID=UPI001CFA799F|nr:kinesin-like protein KIF6 [Protopterus annectens]